MSQTSIQPNSLSISYLYFFGLWSSSSFIDGLILGFLCSSIPRGIPCDDVALVLRRCGGCVEVVKMRSRSNTSTVAAIHADT